jgi:hypothetical protein
MIALVMIFMCIQILLRIPIIRVSLGWFQRDLEVSFGDDFHVHSNVT